MQMLLQTQTEMAEIEPDDPQVFIRCYNSFGSKFEYVFSNIGFINKVFKAFCPLTNFYTQNSKLIMFF